MVVRVVQISHLVELVPEHVAVFDAEEINKVVDVEDLPFQQVGGCFDGEGGLAHSWISVQKEGIVLTVLDVLHEEVEFLLPACH